MNPDNEFQVPVSSSGGKHETGTVGDRICYVRGGRTQPNYAKQLKIGLSTLRNYERGDRKPNADALVAIYEVDGVLSDWILRGEGPMKKGDVVKVHAHDDQMLFYPDLMAALLEAVHERPLDLRLKESVLLKTYAAAYMLAENPEALDNMQKKDVEGLVDLATMLLSKSSKKE